MSEFKFDEIGYWSEIKLEIIRDYAVEYSKIMTNQYNLTHVYIDAFAGAGLHLSKTTKEFIPGSPLNALNIIPPFKFYYFVDLDSDKIDHLKDLVAEYSNNNAIYNGDCNKILLEKVFPQVRYEDRKRALCLLDPYGLHLNWEVIKKAGEMKTIEIFLNFPVADMNRNVLWHNTTNVDKTQIDRMNAFWGDNSWDRIAYDDEETLFGTEKVKNENDVIAEAFRARLTKVAGFNYVPAPIPMRNTKGATVYYLYFASSNKVGAKIVTHIFDKFKNKGAV